MLSAILQKYTIFVIKIILYFESLKHFSFVYSSFAHQDAYELPTKYGKLVINL